MAIGDISYLGSELRSLICHNLTVCIDLQRVWAVGLFKNLNNWH